MFTTIQEVSAATLKAVLDVNKSKTIAEIFNENPAIKAEFEDNFTCDDDTMKLSKLKSTVVEQYDFLVVALANAESESSSNPVEKTYQEMSSREKFEELKKNLVSTDKVERLKKAVYHDCYVSISSISNLPSQAAKGKTASDYKIKEGEGFLILKDAVRKDGVKFTTEELKTIVTEQRLSVKQFAYCLDLLNAGQNYARVKINLEHREKEGVRRYRIEELTKSLNNGETKFKDAQLEREVTTWFNSNSVGVPTTNGKVPMVVCYMPATNSNCESKFYNFLLVEAGELQGVQKVFDIRENVRISEATKPEALQAASIETELLLAKVAKMKAAGWDNELIAMLIKS